jgi:predicted transcriptional regulator|tara:strand:- start:1495 stop:1851 length:357 start_codon:yes stop_codon:yes gene_type:complete
MKSIFLKKQGENPKNKVLDFLITNSELDYSLKEISKYSGAGYSTVKILIKKLVKDKWIVATRKISKIILYKLNTEKPEVAKFIEFYWEVIEQEIQSKKKDNYNSSQSVGSVAVSARGI